MFIAEGVRTIGLLIEREWPLESMLVSERRLAAVSHLVAAAQSAGAVVYVAAQEVLDGVAGFNVHRGVLAVARRPPARTVADVVGRAAGTVLAIEGVNDLENLGALFRNAAALGVGGIVLDPTSADPLYRRAVRVSVGHVLTVPYARAQRWPDDLADLRSNGRRVLALTPAGTQTLDDVLSGSGPGDAWAVLVGAEGDGLSVAALQTADVTVRIPVARGVDSLNVATAAAVALHRLAPDDLGA